MGMLFPSVEHAYQFLKARFHGRPDLCQQILKAPTAAAAKTDSKTDTGNQRLERSTSFSWPTICNQCAVLPGICTWGV